MSFHLRLWYGVAHVEHLWGRTGACDEARHTLVFAASPKYELLATNRLGDGTYASIAPSNSELFIRTSKSLWCISDKK